MEGQTHRAQLMAAIDDRGGQKYATAPKPSGRSARFGRPLNRNRFYLHLLKQGCLAIYLHKKRNGQLEEVVPSIKVQGHVRWTLLRTQGYSLPTILAARSLRSFTRGSREVSVRLVDHSYLL